MSTPTETANYENGKIYRIVSTKTDLVYYGSTIKPLSVRFSVHKNKLSTCSSRKIMAIGGASIELIECFPCSNLYELEDREALYIESNWHGCVNTNIPGAVRRAGGIVAYLKKTRTNHNCAECCGKYLTQNKARHLRTKRHMDAVATPTVTNVYHINHVTNMTIHK